MVSAGFGVVGDTQVVVVVLASECLVDGMDEGVGSAWERSWQRVTCGAFSPMAMYKSVRLPLNQ